MITRRKFITFTTIALGGGIGRLAAAVPGTSLREQISDSDLIYVTPIQSNGQESSCQAEVWYVSEGTALYVVTKPETWRARAVAKGLKQARIWVGDVGMWKDSDGSYRNLPQVEATAALMADKSQHEHILDLFGSKYTMSWLVWGSRFRDGLADGSRVMLRYEIG